ncbi:MAG: C1 family peptidase [Myxococcota bacterium]|jgi:hypothetical protein|nr:C1 family peptidase [Myxococcota bacterium]
MREPRLSARGLLPVALGLAGSLLVTSCLPSDDEVELSGVSAFTMMRTDRTSAPTTDTEAVMAILERRTDVAASKIGGADDIEPPTPVANLMRKNTKAKVRLDPKNRFKLLDFAEVPRVTDAEKPRSKDGVDLATLKYSEYTIPNLEKIPVRDQGQRGTCAAFAGIGHLEYMALKSYKNLRTLDLSEQRFYWMSREDCHAGGCITDDEGGSWYGDGFNASLAGAAPPGANIPLEADCPYNPRPGRNELQVPQLDSCAKGAVKVRQVGTVTTPEEVIRVLEDQGLPVLWASPLSDNWFETSGMITLAEAGSAGDIMHAGGHAYLIVGYRKLNNPNYEGGVCFIVKNSWGSGWGANGYACQTLEWMQTWRFQDNRGNPAWLEHPVLEVIDLRADLQGGDLPDNDEAEDESPPNIPDEELDDGDEDSDGSIIPLPDPEPSPESWTDLPLFGPGEAYYEAQVVRTAAGAHIRVSLKGEVTHSNALYLAYEEGSGKILSYDGDMVGEFRDDQGDFTLCTDTYSMICSLRLDPNDNTLYIEFPYPANRRVDPNGLFDGDWLSLLTEGLLGYDIQFLMPKDETQLLSSDSAFLRMQRPDASRTEPLRLTHNVEGEMKVMGVTVGDLVELELCTGPFEDACSFLATANQFLVLPGW